MHLSPFKHFAHHRKSTEAVCQRASINIAKFLFFSQLFLFHCQRAVNDYIYENALYKMFYT